MMLVPRSPRLPYVFLALFLFSAACESSTDLTSEFENIPEAERLRYFKEINAEYALKAGLSGKGVRVTIMGERVDPRHPDLKGQVVKQYNSFNRLGTILAGEGDAPVPVQNPIKEGHGTHIAGTIAAKCDGIGLQGIACNATLDVYDLGLYGEGEALYGEDDFAFFDAFAAALDDIARRGESRIVTGSFNDETPAIKLEGQRKISSDTLYQALERAETGAGQSDRKFVANALKDSLFAGLSQADREYLIKEGEPYYVFGMAQQSLKEIDPLISAIARFQARDGVYLVTESNVDFGERSSFLNALPSLREEIDPALWLSVVMVVPAAPKSFEAALKRGDLSGEAYAAPASGCGRLAMSYCLVTPSYEVLSTMTPALASSDVPLFSLDERYYQPLSGHSMGAPMVAAALALLEEENKRANLGLTMRALVRIIKENANRQFKGYDPVRHGQGMLDIEAALKALRR